MAVERAGESAAENHRKMQKRRGGAGPLLSLFTGAVEIKDNQANVAFMA
jgi:hypothetical protein